MKEVCDLMYDCVELVTVWEVSCLVCDCVELVLEWAVG